MQVKKIFAETEERGSLLAETVVEVLPDSCRTRNQHGPVAPEAM